MSTKTELINELMRREGWDKYTNDPSDRGGPTRWGVTEKTAREYGYEGDMRFLPYDKAFNIYSARYWDSLQLDTIQEVSEDLTVSMFDFGVHSGPETAGEYLQRLLNVLNRLEQDFDDLTVDGVVGIKTINALYAYRSKRGSGGLSVFHGVYDGLRLAYLFGIAERDESQEKYTYGWFKRVVDL